MENELLEGLKLAMQTASHHMGIAVQEHIQSIIDRAEVAQNEHFVAQNVAQNTEYAKSA